MSNVAVMGALPERAWDAIDCTPSTCDSACSMGSTILRSTAGGEGPGHDSETVKVGLSTSGDWLMPTRVSATTPKRIVDAMSIQANTGFLMETSVMFKEQPRLPATAFRRPCPSRALHRAARPLPV